MKYNDGEYQGLIRIFLNDAVYNADNSYDTRIMLIRKYTEIIIRRLLQLDTEVQITLGDENIEKQLKKNGITEGLFWKALNTIKGCGNDRTHTEKTILAKEDELRSDADALFHLYAYLFVDFFKKYPFGENKRIESHFSILPPVIRCIALTELYKQSPDNTHVIDKLVMAITKAQSTEDAVKWVEDNKEYLKTINYSEADNQETMYDICSFKARAIGRDYHSRKPLYDSFETALNYYRSVGPVEGDSPDVKDFNSLMEFIYSGRREEAMAYC